MTVGRPSLPPGAETLPARNFTDAALFAREGDVFFSRMWCCVGRAEELPGPGTYITRDLAGERLIVLRPNASPDLRAFSNVCRHRGTQLCADESGVFRGSIQCPYHAWTYGDDGRLLAAPHMDGSPAFRKDAYGLHPFAVDEWAGFLFVRTAPDGGPLKTQLAGLTDVFAPWPLASLRRGARIVYDVAANWKLIIQNYSECLHCPTLHPRLNQLSHYLSGENMPLQPGYMGGRMDLSDGVETMSASGRRICGLLPGLSDAHARAVYYYVAFPNLLISVHPDYLMSHVLRPVAPDRTRIVCEWHFHPDALAAPNFDASDALTFWDETNRQDWGVCEQAQIGISSRGYRPGPYSNREELLYAFDRWVLDRLACALDR